jgi:sugar/nucleoside kinase (ribokinase family)
MPDITALGELLIDFNPFGETTQGLPVFIQNPGGAPANLLAAASKLGVSASFIGKVGDDAFGHFLQKVLIENGISPKGLVFGKDAPTTLAFVHLSPSGDRSFSFYRNPGADMTLAPEEVDLALIKESKIFHFGSLSLTHEKPKAASFLAASAARKAGLVVSFDPNFRPALWDSICDFKEAIAPFLPLVDILKVSEEEAEIISGVYESPELAAKALSAMGPKAVLVSMGEKGALFCGQGGAGGFLPAPRVEAVDTTGAGDAFMGTFLGEIVQSGALLSSLGSIGFWRQMLARAICAGSLTCRKKGAMAALPSMEETRELAAELLAANA